MELVLGVRSFSSWGADERLLQCYNRWCCCCRRGMHARIVSPSCPTQVRRRAPQFQVEKGHVGYRKCTSLTQKTRGHERDIFSLEVATRNDTMPFVSLYTTGLCLDALNRICYSLVHVSLHLQVIGWPKHIRKTHKGQARILFKLHCSPHAPVAPPSTAEALFCVLLPSRYRASRASSMQTALSSATNSS